MTKRKKKVKNVGSLIIIVLFVLWTIIPLVLLVQQAFKPHVLMFSDPPTFIFKPIGDHFVKIFSKQNIFPFIINSIIVGVFTTFLCLAFGSMCAYALSKLRIPGKNIWALFILIARMVPVSTLMIPIYSILRLIGLGNKLLAIIIAHTALNLPFAIWMLRSFFDDIPDALEQAALIDGCTRIKCFFVVALPLVSSGLVATGILTMLTSWNEFMFALVLSGRTTRTLPVGISSFVGSVSIDWGGSSAAAVIACLPIFIAGIFVQKYLVRGMTMGAVKG